MKNYRLKLLKNIYPEKKYPTNTIPREFHIKEAMEKYNSDKPDLSKIKMTRMNWLFVWWWIFRCLNRKRKEDGRGASSFYQAANREFREIKKNPDKILAHQYDFVCNGMK